MHTRRNVERVLALAEQGLNAGQIARQEGLARSTVRDWLKGRTPRANRSSARTCARCGRDEHPIGTDARSYAYLLGLYLGDGHISEYARGVRRLRIFLDLRYRGIVDECVGAIGAVAPRSRIGFVCPRPTWVVVSAYSVSWSCVFPQHGPGLKHERPIRLEPWQDEIVERHPYELLRGLIHSDGCRFTNTGRGWSHPRYVFANCSQDILGIFTGACDRLGLGWTSSPDRIYVSRKADVRRMDVFIGPKT